MTTKQIARNSNVITRLESQLKSGVKTLTKKNAELVGANTAPLSENDIKRIEKELNTLKTRI